MARGLFITGTDTGVGKTRVAAALAEALREHGLSVGVMKPVETDCRRHRGRLLGADAARLRRAAHSRDPLELLAPYRYRAALSPLMAARLARRPVRIDRIARAFRELSQRHAAMLVEGSGGLLAPITNSAVVADVAGRLGLPLLIVARAGLGTLNHTLLTVEAARRRGLVIAGIVLNTPRPLRGDASAATNAALLRRLTALPVVGPLQCARLGRRLRLPSSSGPAAGTYRSLLRRGGIVLPTRR